MSFLEAHSLFGGWLRRRFALLLLACASAPFVAAAVTPGDAFPPLASHGIANLAGGTLPPTEGKIVLVDFWASWCAPCKASFPMMAKLHADYASRGLVIVAISIDEKPAAATAFVKKMSPPFATLHDPERKLVEKVEVPTMPSSYLLGRDGRVRFVHEGYAGESTQKELRKQIEALLAESS